MENLTEVLNEMPLIGKVLTALVVLAIIVGFIIL